MKEWIINIAIQKAGPSLIRAALAAFVGVLLAHSNQLALIGIVYDKASDTIMWHLSTVREWMATVGLGLVASFFMIAQHHTVAAVTGTAHNGSDQGTPQ